MNDLAVREKETAVAPASTQAMVAGVEKEIEAAVIIAHRFPRDQGRALKNIESACTNTRLAELAEYSYPKGGTTVEGPSIRLLEAIVQSWGNVRGGVKITHQTLEESHATAWAWDLETNAYYAIDIIVPHIRDTKKGSYPITDKREIYELVANQGARRYRKCLETIIPRHIVDAARDAANQTMNNLGDLETRRAKMIEAFKKAGVSQDQIEKRLGKKIVGVGNAELTAMNKIYNSLRDGMTKVADWFESTDPEMIIKEQTEGVKADPAQTLALAQKMFHKASADAKNAGADPLALLRAAIPNPKLTQADVDKATGAVLTAYAELIDQWVKANQP